MSENHPLRTDIPKPFLLSSASPNRLVHLIPDQLAREVPDHPLFSYPKAVKPQDGFQDISAKRFANGINRASWYLLELLGTLEEFETIGYMGPNDIRYFLLMFAAIKVGYKMLFSSPRNTLDAHLNVLEGVNCKHFLYGKGVNVSHILEAREMRSEIIPELSQLLDDSPVEIFPYTKTFEEARMDPCLVLHTTGSTGLPKPITWKLGTLSTYEAWRTIPHVDGYVPTPEIYQQSRRAYTSMPLFHTSGLNAGITWALCLGVTLVYGDKSVVPNASYTDEMHRHAGVDATMGAPSLYEELSRDPESLELMHRLKYVVASGAPLSLKAGTLISEHTRVISNLGATETACLQRLCPSIDDWAYFYWHPTHSGIEMREHSDGLFELFLTRDRKLDLFQGIFHTFPDIEEWSMKDLYERHPNPEKPFLYRYMCRRDDVIVLSNGEKIAPALMEATLQSDPLVKGAMVVGRGKFQPAALIDLAVELPSTPEQRYSLLEKLRPIIKDANEHAPGHAKLDQHHILFADAKKGIHYLGQGKIQRLRTYALYEDEIEELYRAASEGTEYSGFTDLPAPDFSNKDSIASWLAKLVAELISGPGFRSDPDSDLFQSGLDSLHVMKMAREINFQAKQSGLREPAISAFGPKMIYANPSLKALAAHLHDKNAPAFRSVYTDTSKTLNADRNSEGEARNDSRHQGTRNSNEFLEIGHPICGADDRFHAESKDGAQVSVPTDPMEEARQLLDKYTNGLPPWSHSAPAPSTKRMHVLLTGSTGSLGSYLLDSLLRDPQVEHIVCLNRSADAAQKQKKSAKTRGLMFPGPDKVEFLQSDLAKPYLGLQPQDYERLRGGVTHVIHNQWPVNFNFSLASFERSVRGVHNVAHFSYASVHQAFILFVSSVSAAGAWQAAGSVPEEINSDLGLASDMGYAQSKLIAENLLDEAARRCGIRSAVCRVGIIAGPIERNLGMWNKHEYVPSIIISSAHLGAFPREFPSRDRVDWLPVEKVSRVLIELLHSSSGKPETQSLSGASAYHVVNPKTQTWSSLAHEILASYPKRTKIEAMSFEEWVDKLAASAGAECDPELNPAVRLLDFYKETLAGTKRPRSFISKRAEADSSTLRGMEVVSGEWIRRWIRQWGIRDE